MSLITDLLLDLIGSGVGPSTDRGLVATFSAGSIVLTAVTVWLVMTFPDPIRQPEWGLAVSQVQRSVVGRIWLAELHWYEAHGIGKKEFKRKRYLD